MARFARAVPQMVIVADTGRSRPLVRPVPALEAYGGPCFSALRARVGTSLPHRLRVFVLSTRYGLIGANERLRTYDPLRRVPDDGLQARLRRTLYPYLAACPVKELLLLMPTHYLDVLPRVTGHVGEVHTIVKPVRCWPEAEAFLDRWGWP
ncbi:hypothetical protein [Yinghuangia sp. YIM S09857]|uniref:hypothetical protein n=1 Tax=Yinghuangia sp. YIM S09857 TaxID=3436929 RepID=UPI003F5370FF